MQLPKTLNHPQTDLENQERVGPLQVIPSLPGHSLLSSPSTGNHGHPALSGKVVAAVVEQLCEVYGACVEALAFEVVAPISTSEPLKFHTVTEVLPGGRAYVEIHGCVPHCGDLKVIVGTLRLTAKVETGNSLPAYTCATSPDRKQNR